MTIALTYNDHFVARLLEKVDQYEDLEKCWTMQRSTGHPTISYKGKQEHAYAIFHEYLFGPIPPGTERHHKCKNDRCINPCHIEVLTCKEHSAQHPWTKLERCIRGHELSGDNLYIRITSKGYEQRTCRECNRERCKTFHRKRKSNASKKV